MSTRASSSSASSSFSSSLYLHECAFQNRLDDLRHALDHGDPASNMKYDINGQDRFGNTPLLIAVMKNHLSVVELLLDRGALIKMKNAGGWTAIAEAVSIGNRTMLALIWKTFKKRSEDEFKSRYPEIMEKIQLIPDFHLVIEWKFSSWVPLLGRFLPSDTYHIYKKGNQIRLETTLVDFNQLNWIRGDIAFVFTLEEAANGETEGKVKLVAIDNEKKCYAKLNEKRGRADGVSDEENEMQQRLEDEEEKEEFELELDHLMASPISELSNPGRLVFQRAKSGIWGWRKDKEEMIYSHNCRVFSVKNIVLLSQKRMEHLSEEEKANREKMANIMSRPKELEAKLKEQEEKEKQRKERKRRMRMANKSQQNSKENSRNSANQADGEDETEINSNRDASKNSSQSRSGAAESEFKSVDDIEPVVHRPSLPPPEPSPIAFQDYFKDNYIVPRHVFEAQSSSSGSGEATEASAEAEHFEDDTNEGEESKAPITVSSSTGGSKIPHLGRAMDLKEERKQYSATLWMTDTFPLTLETVVQLLEMAAPRHRHVLKLKNFIERRLPPGFPMKLVMPVFPTVSATVTFVQYEEGNVPQEKFEIPPEYKEDRKRFESLDE